MGITTSRIVIVDDDPLVRAGLKMIIASDEIEIVGEGGDGVEALSLTDRLAPDLVLLDIRMPNLDGLEVTRRLRGQGSTTRILILTTFDTDEFVIEALRSGANGFLLKDTAPAEIVAAIHKTVAGEPVLSAAATQRLIAAISRGSNEHAARAKAQLAGLTDRELDVAKAIARGLANHEIAAELFIGVTTVKSHIASLFTKLRAGNRVEIARVVLQAEAT